MKFAWLQLVLLSLSGGFQPAEPEAWILDSERTALFPGQPDTEPAVVVTSSNRVVVAAVVLKNHEETLLVRQGSLHPLKLGPELEASQRGFSARPVLALGPEDRVWLGWTGSSTQKDQEPLWHIQVREIMPNGLAPPKTVWQGALPVSSLALTVDAAGKLHLAWEAWDLFKGSIHLHYRSLLPDGTLFELERLSSHGFERRPALCSLGNTIYLAWDRLINTGATGDPDPDFDVFISSRSQKQWSFPRSLDSRPGIQAAAHLVCDPKLGVLVAYHSSHEHSLVKWWVLRRLWQDEIQEWPEPKAWEPHPQGENQGAEFPALLVVDETQILVASRPSQGAYLQRLDSHGSSKPVELSNRGWGARGMRTVLAKGPGRRITLVRRARNESVLETFVMSPLENPTGLTFVKIHDPPKPTKESVRSSNRPKSVIHKRQVHWGDLHMHSAASDGTGPPDEILARAWVRGQDFAALTDHDTLVGRVRFPSTALENLWVTEVFDRKAEFVTLPAFEWTTPPIPKGHGHRNIYFKNPQSNYPFGSRVFAPTTKKLFERMASVEVLAVPHHTTWTGTDLEGVLPDQQPLFEIVSLHGATEKKDRPTIPARGNLSGMYAQDFLDKGIQVGFVGGSDAHGLLWHHGIGRKRDPWACGLTGVWVEELSRESLFNALKSRRCFATSGIVGSIWLQVENLEMGQAGAFAKGPLRIEVEIGAFEEPAWVEIVRNGEEICQKKLQKPYSPLSWTDRTVGPGTHSYYAKVTFENRDRPSEIIWSSPVFVSLGEKILGK